jgi:putative membrane protein
MVKRLTLSPADHARISRAIEEAEAGTTGEIFAVFARSSDAYLGPACAAALAFSLGAGFVTAAILAWAGITVPALALETAQAVGALALVGLLLAVPSARLLLVPRSVQLRHARRLALAQFLSHNIHATQARTGVLLFVSEAEHHAEVVADSGIAAKVPQSAWDEIVDRLTDAAGADRLADGFVAAAHQSGRLLATHFPGRPGDRNEIPDRIVEI